MTVYIYFLLLLAEALVLLGVAVYGFGLIFSSLKGAPYVPTSKKQLEKIFKNISLKKDDVFVELGSGDGRLVRYAITKYKVQGIGIEINPLLVWWSQLLAKRDGSIRKVQFIRKNIFDYSLTKVDYLYIFLMPELIQKLLPKFKKELKKGVIIISHGFKIIGFEKKLIHTEPDKTFSTYYYKI
ncbi:MAG: hypothetical protein NTV98_04405 [Candidatus Roizmanbacteria bacterium]|nr:hypothetical protein [Candidatus Roizmanbacteria bacterium]